MNLPDAIDAARAGRTTSLRCPGHDDRSASLSALPPKEDGWVRLKCHAGCSLDQVLGGAGLSRKHIGPATSQVQPIRKREIATYDYRDEAATLLFQVVRYEPKDFRQRRPDGNGGWIWDLNNVRKVLFRLSDVRWAISEKRPVIIAEGEKDALSLISKEWKATCNPMGAGKWEPGYTEMLKGGDIIIIPDNDAAGENHLAVVANALRGNVDRLRVLRLPKELNGSKVKDASDYFNAGGTIDQFQTLIDDAPDWIQADTKDAQDTAPAEQPFRLPRSDDDLHFHEQLVASVESTRFHPNNPPPEEPWAFKLAGVEVAHCGNIITIAAAVKSGKSSVISAMTASMMSSIGQDYLGFEGNNPDGKAVLHYDTEQSRGDHYHMMMRALRRADLQTPPSWFSSYSLTLLDPAERRAAISAMARKAAANGGLHSLFIDGVADLVFDVNDLKEACSLVTELHQLATETSCVIVTALHHNPGGEKTRGHLGSQIERKSESVLVLRKDDETISISCKPARRQEISGDKAPCFEWNSQASMHLLTQSKAATTDDRKRVELRILADEVFGGQSHLKWVALKNAIMAARDCSQNTASTRINEMKKLGAIKQSIMGNYEKSQP